MMNNEEEHEMNEKWLPNPVGVVPLILITALGIGFIIGSFFLFMPYGDLAIPLVFFVIIVVGFAVIYLTRLELLVKPRYVAVSDKGIWFKYKDGSIKIHKWTDIKEISMTPQEIGVKKMGMIRLFDTRYPIPIPYEAFEEAIILKKRNG